MNGFVRAQRSGFAVDGQPFRVAGANNYYLSHASDEMVAAVFDAAARMGLNTLRTWAFLERGPKYNDTYFQYLDPATKQPAYNDGENGLQLLDRTIAVAEQRGIRLILPLVNYWDDFGGISQYLSWFGLKDKAEFYTHPGLRAAYRNYVEHVLLRVNPRMGRQYRDEPAILAWELCNEPRDIELAWVAEMTGFLRSLDSNHLIGVGDEGLADTERLLAISTVDFGTCHLYPGYSPKEDAVGFGKRWIREHIEAGQRANKPMIVEEFGVKAEAGRAARDAAYAAWLGQVEASGGAGALIWMLAAAPYPDYDHYTVYAPEDAPALCRFAAG